MRLTNEYCEAQTLPFLAYELHWHWLDYSNELKDLTITPIRVVRYGISPGCSLPSITALNYKGERLNGTPEDYYVSAGDAYMAALQSVKEQIESRLEAINDNVRALNAEVALQDRLLKKGHL